MASTDFPNGLSDVNEFLDTRHHINKDITGEVGDEARVVIKSEFDFTLREIICNLLAGRGLKLPNIQVCLSVNLKAILGVPGIQQDLLDALNELDQEFDKFMEHTKIEEVLGRVNKALAEVTQIANMINFCAAPIAPVAIPNVLEQSMESFLGAGKDIIDAIGNMIPDQVGGCLNFNGQEFNLNMFNGGILGEIASDWQNIKSGNLTQARLDALVASINNIKSDLNSLMDRENSVVGTESLGGSQFPGDVSANTNTAMGVLHNAESAGIQGNTRIASLLKAQYDRLGGYPVIDKDGKVYKNIFELILEPGMLNLLKNLSDPTPDIGNRQPVFNYCGEIVGYTAIMSQDDPDASNGIEPGPLTPEGLNIDITTEPGYNAGGLDTSEDGITTAGSANITNVTNINTVSGSSVFFAFSDSQQINTTSTKGSIVVRPDLGQSYAHNGGTSNTLADFTPLTVVNATGDNGPYLIHLDNQTNTGLVVKNGAVSEARSIVGTSNEINVVNADGIAGNPILSIAADAILPGAGGITIPSGNTSQRRQPVTGAIRYNTDSNSYEGYHGGSNPSWQSFNVGTATVTGAANIGTGQDVFNVNNQGVLEFRRINGTGAIGISNTGNQLEITENIGAYNVGGGAEVLKQRNGNNFEHRTIVAGQNIKVTQVGDTIEIAGDENQIKMDPQSSSGPGASEVLFNGSRVSPPNNTSWFFEITAVGRRTNGPGYTTIKLQGMVDNNNGVISVVQNSANKTVFSNTVGSGWDVYVDNSQGDFRVFVQGALGADVNWATKLDIIPVS